jgi:hypothetical protein
MVVAGTAEIRRPDQGGAIAGEPGHEPVAATPERAIETARGGEVHRVRVADDVDVALGVDRDAAGLLGPGPAHERGPANHRIDDQRERRIVSGDVESHLDRSGGARGDRVVARHVAIALEATQPRFA